MIEKAKAFATEAHKGQKRKSSNEDYIVHPIRVAYTLQQAECSKELICAGFLHDVVEDTPYELEDIEKEFGPAVTELVAAHTEDKTKSWHERKAHTIEVVRTGNLEVKSLIVADKWDNLQSIEEGQHKMGEAIWSYFNSSYDQQKWYYQSVANNMWVGIPEKEAPEFFHSYSKTVQRFFT
ncbi:phosphohydrolase [Halobacillus andaensis]|uniref:Phosphohydrolase n=1 Tax=Halobacillus andaensis TaxID=1176239 RepID=A0A917BC63_HALAA|nr:HD domain-containing protein [Halobacillus andaensis]MBP2006354.1 (p)ppGpp synthase/HD superfamily hydrolase [Halobacillus andaensis]GGF34491.1 phosphohydrolase [Halobacillus andaensis]